MFCSPVPTMSRSHSEYTAGLNITCGKRGDERRREERRLSGREEERKKSEREMKRDEER